MVPFSETQYNRQRLRVQEPRRKDVGREW